MTRPRHTATKKAENKSTSKSGILSDPSTIDLSEAQEADCPAFRAFLLENRSTVGDALLEDKGEPWDKADMRAIEDMIKGSDLDDNTQSLTFRFLTKCRFAGSNAMESLSSFPRRHF